jgi:hypothetical protein
MQKKKAVIGMSKADQPYKGAKSSSSSGETLNASDSVLTFRGEPSSSDRFSMRVRVLDADGFSLPWDIIVRGKYANRLVGATLVISIGDLKETSLASPALFERNEPWD